MRHLLLSASFLLLATQARADGGIFVGSTPCGATVRQFLGLPAVKCDVIRWELSLGLDAKAAEPGPAAVQIEYGPNGKPLKKLRRDLRWERGVGADERKGAQIVELKRGKSSLFLWKINDETLYVLDSKQRLLAGDAERGYALSFAVVDKLSASTHAPGTPLPRKPLAAGPDVFGVFAGNTPCDIAQTLTLSAPADCGRVEWRLTLFKDPKSKDPTRYRLESPLFGATPREGAVTLLDGTPFDPLIKVLKLDAPEGAEPVYLMRGSDDVLLFLDSAGKLGLGNRYYHYVLSRQKA